jgi:hypothetical protein
MPLRSDRMGVPVAMFSITDVNVFMTSNGVREDQSASCDDESNLHVQRSASVSGSRRLMQYSHRDNNNDSCEFSLRA